MNSEAVVQTRSNGSKHIRVLMADPDESLRPLYREHLLQEGFELVTASSGLECVARLRERAAAEPDLLPVILQWEEGFLTDDRIAAEELDRKPAHRVRVMFREVLQELAAELSVAPVTGKEMLL